MPANGRSCATCEWWDDGCVNVKSHTAMALDVIAATLIGKSEFAEAYQTIDGWCSEWKSAEPEICGQCHWLNFILDECGAVSRAWCGSRASIELNGGIAVNDIDFADGACRVFRRKSDA